MDATARLTGWKAIGRYLGCTERTARRWENQRALPVHRIPGGARQAVWADPAELDRWLDAVPAEVRAELQAAAGLDTDPIRAKPGRRALPWRLLAVLALATALAVPAFLMLRPAKPAAGARTPQHVTAYDADPLARDLYDSAAFELSERTPTSLATAEHSFMRLTELYPQRAPAWAGLADVYVLQREFSGINEAVVFPKALEAANRALALDPGSANAWLDKGFVAWWWKGDAAGAFAAFDRALELAPGWARAYHWYATVLEANGDFARSLDMIARARALDPENRAIVADEGVIRFDAGEREQALAMLETHARLDPDFVSWHMYLVHAYGVLGRDEDFLRESIQVARLRGQPDMVVELEQVQGRLRAGGHGAMLDALTDLESRGIAKGDGHALAAARYRALAHDREGMYQWLRLAEARGEQGLASLAYYLEFTEFSREPEFLAIVQRHQPGRDRR